MRDYGKVSAMFWTGETGRRLRGHPEAQIVAMYLMTGPMANMIGLYHLPLALIAHHTGLSAEGASEGLQRAIQGGFCHYDYEREEVFVPEMARYQIGDSLDAKDNQCKGIAKQVETYCKSRFYHDFHERYGRAFHLPKPRPFKAPRKPLRSQEQEQEQEREQEQEPPTGGAAGSAAVRFRELFVAAWQSKYGRKYKFAGAKDGSAVKALVGCLDETEWGAVIGRYFADGGDFFTGHPIAKLSSQVHRFLVGKPDDPAVDPVTGMYTSSRKVTAAEARALLGTEDACAP
jgi:hypothetical protein